VGAVETRCEGVGVFVIRINEGWRNAALSGAVKSK
jgi:hypothetical protein